MGDKGKNKKMPKQTKKEARAIKIAERQKEGSVEK